MEVYLFDQVKYQQLYNCSFYNVSRIPLEDRAHPYWGVFYLTFYVIFMVTLKIFIKKPISFNS
jgi:hypothetical protein